MRKIATYILSLNERFAYNVIGILRSYFLVPFTNLFLRNQAKKVSSKVNSNVNLIKENFLRIIPQVTNNEVQLFFNDIEKKSILIDADNILLSKIKIFTKQIDFKGNIDWHTDVYSGFTWEPGLLFSKYKQVDLDNNADVKFPRELSRSHHFLTLGKAYLLTKDEKYALEFVDQINDWIKENPYKKSINWGCSMDVAIRSSNWIYALRMFENSSEINDEFLKKIFSSLYMHARYINEHPEKNRVYNHNHYLSDLAGLILLSLLFNNKEDKESTYWKDNSIYEFYREIRLQILPSGFTYERTTNYHRLVTELIAYTVILLDNNLIEVPRDIEVRVEKMFEVINHYQLYNGISPAIGDQDSGRFLPFYQYDVNDQKYLMNIGAVMFNNGKFKYYSSSNLIDILFLFGKKGIDSFNKLPTKDDLLESKSYSDTGFAIMRSDLSYVFINNSGLSHYSELKTSTHTHSDLLSFVYAFNNNLILVDPGTYVYSSYPSERMKFRSTYMHNTVTVDALNQNDLKARELWRIEKSASPKELKWESSEDYDIYKGSHNAYERLDDPVTHIRNFELDKQKDILKITDKIICNEHHEISAHFHFDEGVDVKIVNDVMFISKENETLKMTFDCKNKLSFELKEDYISKGYYHKVLAPYLEVRLKCNSSVELITTISPVK